MKQLITFRSYSKIFSCLFISTCLLTSFTVHAQKANKIFELLQEKKISKAVEKRNKGVVEAKSGIAGRSRDVHPSQ